MPLLTDHPWKIAYGPAEDRLHEFYIPALERSVRFDRATGFFSSAALAIAAAGVARLIANGGRMRLLCGAQLSPEDVDAIRRGAEMEDVVGQAMAGSLVDPADTSMRARLEALAWLVANERLDIQVVLPRGPDGLPIPGDIAREYYHPKEGVFEDAGGNRLAFSGSVNDSASGWQHNYETFSVYTSWPLEDGADTINTRPYLRLVEERFRRLWSGEEPDWIALEVPEAARLELLKYAPAVPPLIDPLERRAAPPGPPASSTEQRERILFEFLRLAPFLPNASRLGVETATVRPWPHQRRVVREAVDRYPESFLFCDEVGLGKTIEAGLALRQLIVSGQVERALLLVPKSVLRQWQEELYEKFVLNIPRYDDGRLLDVFDRDVPHEGRVWDAVPLLLASSQLAKRRDRQGELLHPDAKRWDLVLVDEAHHARRKEFLTGQYRPNRLLELLAGSASQPGLKDRTRAMYLLTATPMQVHPVEVWDLLRLLGLGGRWGADEDKFVDYFRELRKIVDGAARPDWNFLLDMFRDFLEMGGAIDETFARAAAERGGWVEWEAIRNLPFSHTRDAQIAQLSGAGRAILVELLRRHTPLRRFVWRNTRQLLRRYRERGILTENVPRRDPRNQWIPLSEGPGSESDLYHRVEEYISDFYRRYEAERRGLGFVMTVYRRRLTSSFYALRRSLERRRAFLEGRALAGEILTDDDLEDEDLDFDFTEELEDGAATPGFREELRYIGDFIAAIDRLGTDSKLAHLQDQIAEIFTRRETLLVFTQYTDTMDYLRDQLVHVYGGQVACYSGRGGEVWDGTAWLPRPKEELKEEFRRGERIKILLCTEAASEGLNLQTCGVLINYDMPWNPMRVEQRIGRIDRIGQRYDEVWVSNYFYRDTVEAVVYQRLSDRIRWFESVVGELQPILHRVASSIEKLAMMRPDERQRRLDQEIAELREMADRGADYFDVAEYLDEEVDGADELPPLSLHDMERTLLESSRFGRAFRPHSEIQGAHLLERNGAIRAVTFAPDVFDRHPSSIELISFGSDLLSELLDAVPRPVAGPEHAGILERWTRDPAPLAWLAQRGRAGVATLDTLAALQTALGEQPMEWTAEDIAAADALYQHVRDTVAARYERVAQDRRKGEMLALKETARRVLIETALLDARRAEQPSLGDPPAAPLFGVDAIRTLDLQGVPYRALLSVILADETISAERDDPFYRSLEGKSNAALAQRRENMRRTGVELLTRWRALDVSDPAMTPRTERVWLRWFPTDTESP